MLSAVWNETDEELVINDQLDLLSMEEEELLSSDEKLRGEIDVFRYFSTGRGTASRIVLVLQEPVTRTVKLPVPVASVIYLQEGNQWRSIPESVSVVEDLHILVDTVTVNGRMVTEARLILSGGGTELMGGVGWTPEPTILPP